MTAHLILESVVTKTSIWNRAKEPRQLIQYVDVSAVSSNRLEIVSPTLIEGHKAPSRAQKIIRAGDILFATIRPSLKRIAKVPQRLDGEVASTAFCVLRPNPKIIDSKFLFFSVCHDSFVSSVTEHEAGASYPAVRDKDIFAQTIWVPDLRIQSKIARCVDALHLATLRQLDLIEQAETLKQAAMSQLFTRGLRGEAQKETEIGLVPESWEVVQLGSLGKIGNGSTPKKTLPEYWIGGTYPWLTSAKVYDREITSADQFVTDTALAKCHLPRVKPGAVLMAITGQGKTLGHCAVLTIESSVSQHVAYLQTDTRRADPSFVRGYLETQYEYLRQVASGGGSTKGALTCAFLKSLPIPLPALVEQREIVTILDAIDRKIALHQQKESVLDELFRSLLHKLMTGEISVEDLDLSALTSEEPQPKTEAEAPS